MGNVVRLGDGSSHGGTMVSAGTTVLVNGVPMCVSGDSHSCPIPYHGVTSVTGTSSVESGGKAVIKTGDVAGCGASVISGSPNVTFG